MKLRRFWKILTALAIMGFALVLFLSYRLHSFPQVEAYFEDPPVRTLQPDEQGQWQYVRHLYTEMEATGEQFKGWDESQQDLWKDAIAFAAYGLPSLAIIKPEDRNEVAYYLSVMIHKMKAKKVWQDWQRYGFGDDPLGRDNVSYTSHLNLMYGLYQLMTGSDRYAPEFTWLTKKLIEDIKGSGHGNFRGLVCEPDRYAVPCNAVALLSLEVFDRIYGTSHAKVEGQEMIAFIQERMIDPETGLYRAAFHPSHNLVLPDLSGSMNAWAMVMLRPFDREYEAHIYPQWKRMFVREFGPFASIRETPGGGPSRLASLFGMLAAKEFGDLELFRKLRNTIDFAGMLHRDNEFAYLSYGAADNTLLNGLVFSFKLHVGWQTILDYPWPQPSIKPVMPEISAIQSFDVMNRRDL